MTLVHLLIFVVVLAGVAGVAAVVLRQSGVTVPPFVVSILWILLYVVNILWILLAAVLGLVAIQFLMSAAPLGF